MLAIKYVSHSDDHMSRVCSPSSPRPLTDRMAHCGRNAVQAVAALVLLLATRLDAFNIRPGINAARCRRGVLSRCSVGAARRAASTSHPSVAYRVRHGTLLQMSDASEVTKDNLEGREFQVKVTWMPIRPVFTCVIVHLAARPVLNNELQ